jgi:glycoprotein 3-alpha-L-fucosyltransferase
VSAKPWYFTGGSRYPKSARINKVSKKRNARLTPAESQGDRITNQLMFVPPNYDKAKKRKLKTILLYNGLAPWNVRQGKEVFKHAKCPVNSCFITAAREKATTADLILYKDHYIPPNVPRQPHQVYMMYFLECPYHTQLMKVPNAFNWTATYR